MTRPRGSVNRSHIPIVDRKSFGELVDLIIDRAGGVRPLSRRWGVPPARWSEWRNEKRGGLSREQFEQLGLALLEVLQETEATSESLADAYWRSLNELYAALGSPRDGKGLHPEPKPVRRGRKPSPSFIEDIIGEAASEKLARGMPPAPDSAFWKEGKILDRPLLVKRRHFEMIKAHLHISHTFESNESGPAFVETEKGERVKMWLSHYPW